MLVNYGYYTSTYTTENINKRDFDMYNDKAQLVVEAITKMSENELSQSDKLENIKKGICAEIEYLSINKNVFNSVGEITSESIGSYSYTKSNQKSKSVNGLPIAPLLELYLKNAGLMKVGFIDVC